MGELKVYEGVRTCDEQVISTVELIPSVALPSGNIWTVLQNNNNNEYYFSLADGSWNNNNKNNSYHVVLVESKTFIELIFRAEENCWKNKHSSWDAAKYHYHLGRRIWEFAWRLYTWNYQPWQSICFIVLYPKPREVFAAHYQDRIAHHIVAPYMIAVAEAVHRANGNVSYGNRKKMSCYHACLHLQRLMQKHPNGYVASWDIKSFFMSIDREVAWEIFCHYEQRFRPAEYSEEMRKFMMYLIKTMILYDPASNCEKRSPQWLWDSFIKPHKTLFKCDGKGEPIGNYYAQLIANLILAIICEMLKEGEHDALEFVDDFSGAGDDKEEMHAIEQTIDSGARKIRLELHPTKRYIQPVRHGIKWCGFVVYANRMYVSNRPVRNCIYKIRTKYKNVTLSNAEKLMQTLNSYFGLMCHCASWNIQNRIAKEVIDIGYGEYLEFKQKGYNHLVCNLKDEYKRKNRSRKTIEELDKEITNLKNKYKNGNHSSSKKRKAL